MVVALAAAAPVRGLELRRPRAWKRLDARSPRRRNGCWRSRCRKLPAPCPAWMECCFCFCFVVVERTTCRVSSSFLVSGLLPWLFLLHCLRLRLCLGLNLPAADAFCCDRVVEATSSCGILVCVFVQCCSVLFCAVLCCVLCLVIACLEWKSVRFGSVRFGLLDV